MMFNDLIKEYGFDNLVKGHTVVKTNKELLDNIDINVIENYIREKKLLKIKGNDK